MARITDDSRERVRDAVDFVELVGSRTELKRAGVRRYVGLCPFHEERSPSFGIDPVEKLYHCFGCGAGGDVFRFVMETEGLDFGAALESLADRAGIELERDAEDPRAAERRSRRERLLALLERTAAYYVRVLWEAPEAADAREYLLGRGLEEGSLREFRVGYAPSAWDKVLLASRRAGYSEEELRAAGLVQRSKEGRYYDAFRRRITFPLTDARGRVLGFGARAMGENQGPKYVNTRESEVFTKGRQLFAVDLARAPAGRAGAVVLAEGYTDVIALRQAGIAHAVGLMGTALTEEQAAELGRLAKVVLLCLDADAAGQAAMVRAAGLVAARGNELRVVPLPPGADPADIVAREGGAEEMRALLDRAMPFARFQVERALDRAVISSAEGRDRSLEEVAEVIRPMPQGVLREELVQLTAGRLRLSENLAATVLGSPSGGRGPGAAAFPPFPFGRPSTAPSARSAPSSRSASRCPSRAPGGYRRWTSTPRSPRPSRAAPPPSSATTPRPPPPRSPTMTPSSPPSSPSSSCAPTTTSPPPPRSRSRSSSSSSPAWTARSPQPASRARRSAPSPSSASASARTSATSSTDRSGGSVRCAN